MPWSFFLTAYAKTSHHSPENKNERVPQVGEHIRRYDHLAAELNSVGVLLAGHDHQGHGRSEGYPVDIDSFDSYVADLIQHSKAMQRARPGIPLFLFGHSMGGEIAILTAHAAPSLYVGALFSAPAILPGKQQLKQP